MYSAMQSSKRSNDNAFSRLFEQMEAIFLTAVFCQDRALYEDIIVQVNFVITAFAFTLMFFVPFVPLYFAYQAQDLMRCNVGCRNPVASCGGHEESGSTRHRTRCRPQRNLYDCTHEENEASEGLLDGFVSCVSFDNWEMVRRPSGWKRCKKSRRKTRQRY